MGETLFISGTLKTVLNRFGLLTALAFQFGFLVLPLPAVAQDTAADPAIELLHLWRVPAEQVALHVLRDELIELGVEWHDTSVLGGASGVRQQLSNLMAAEAPPSIVQWVPSEEMSELFEIGVFREVDTVDSQYSSRLLPEVRAVAEIDGVLRTLPIGIHTYDFMALNRALLEEFGGTVPETWETLLDYGPVLEERGVPLLSVSNENWQVNALYRAILVSQFSKEDVLSLFSTNSDFGAYRLEFERTFEILFALRRFASPNRSDLRWEDAVARVETGEAFSVIIGDYMVASFHDQDNMVCSRSPESRFIPWAFDSFVFTETGDAGLERGQALFAQAISRADVMVKYVERKGGLPVISGVSLDALTLCNAATMEAWNRGPKLWDGLIQGKIDMLLLRSTVHSLWMDETISPSEATDILLRTLDRP
jgi:glucose/mannose transport system substrate-binding protein